MVISVELLNITDFRGSAMHGPTFAPFGEKLSHERYLQEDIQGWESETTSATTEGARATRDLQDQCLTMRTSK